MAAIYTVKNGELHIYYNRVPKKDGREPLLIWPVLFFVMVGLTFLAVLLVFLIASLAAGPEKLRAFLAQDDNIHRSLPIWFICNAVFLYTFCQQFFRIVFSPTRREVYWKFLFLRRRLASFDEIGAINEMSMKILFLEHFHFAAAWADNRKKPPIRLSPRVRQRSRLARYFHTVVPHARYLLGHAAFATQPANAPGAADEAEAVAVETVELSYDEASRALFTTPEAEPEHDAEAKRFRDPDLTREYTWFRQGKWGYRSRRPFSGWIVLILFFGFIGGLAYLAICLGDGHLPWRVVCGAIALFFLFMFLTNATEIGIDPERRVLTFFDYFGLKKREHPVTDLRRIVVKRKGILKALLVGLEGEKKVVGLFESTRLGETEEALEEFGALAGVDVGQFTQDMEQYTKELREGSVVSSF